MTTRPGARIRAFRRFLVLAVALCALTATLERTGVGRARLAHDRGGDAGDRARRPGDQGHLAGLRADARRRHRRRRDHAVPGAPEVGAERLQHRRDVPVRPQRATSSRASPHKDGTGSVFIDIMTTARLPSLACSETHAVLAPACTRPPPNGFDPNGLPPAKTRVIVPLQLRAELGRLPAGAALRLPHRDRGVGRAGALPVGRRLVHRSARVHDGRHQHVVEPGPGRLLLGRGRHRRHVAAAGAR